MSCGENLPGPGEGLDGRQHGPVPAASLEQAMSEFAGYVVNRLFSVGLSLESARSIVRDGPAGDRVAAATAEVDRMIRDIRTVLFDLAADHGNDSPDRWSPRSGRHPDRAGEWLDQVVDSIGEVSALLQASADLPRATVELRITEARRSLDDLARKVRDHAFAERGHRTWPALASRSPLGGQGHLAPAADRAALLQERMAHTARGLHEAAADYAALLEHRADLAGKHGRMDYPTEIKRWRAFAEQAGHMASRWEHPPQPEAPPDGVR